MITKIFTFIGRLLSRYAHPFEKKVQKFLRGLSSTSNRFSVQRQLTALMKENTIVLNLWLERQFKGYSYLTKSTRRRLYANVKKIEDTFDAYIKTIPRDHPELRDLFMRFPSLAATKRKKEKATYLFAISQFLHPGRHYHYVETSNFGRLLKNPKKELLEGDCNQIVTLYVHMYARKFPVRDLKIKLLAEHVCLHFFDVDLEATTGTFVQYKKFEAISPIVELISTNLLDVSDFRENKVRIDERTFVKGSQLAFLISSNHEIVTHNLKVSYQKLGWEALQEKEYESAIYYLEKAGNKETLDNALNNIVISLAQENNFRKARHYANKLRDRDLAKWVIQKQALYYYDRNQFETARKYFREAKDEEGITSTYVKEFFELHKKVENDGTVKEAKRHKHIYTKLKTLARKAKLENQEKWAADVLDQIQSYKV